MIFPETLKKTLLISVLGHITVFSIFSFSFGAKVHQVNFAGVSFWGAILRPHDLATPHSYAGAGLNRKSEVLTLSKINKEYSLISRDYLKPTVTLTRIEKKIIFIPPVDSVPFAQERKQPVIMLYPNLPYHFLLYFKDRQVVHIELMFNIIPSSIKNSIVIKRKISSGNLEVDLLSMRYISRYLFIQQRGFTSDSWQTVKIDFSAK